MTSTMVGSSSQLVIAPIAVLSMPMLLDAASGLTRTDPPSFPKFATAWCGQMPGTIKLKRHRFRGMQQLKSGRRAAGGSSVDKRRFDSEVTLSTCDDRKLISIIDYRNLISTEQKNVSYSHAIPS
jgi:hypothetical protein